MHKGKTVEFYNRPMAIAGLTSYRYASRYGWIMIGARDNAEALCEASRSAGEPLELSRLQIWNGSEYVPC